MIRPATKTDAPELAYLINLAGEGLPEYLWSSMCKKGETPFDVGRKRAGHKEGGFSYTKARIFEVDNTVAGMVLSYRQADPYETGSLDEYPDFIRPLIELEALAPGSWYINAVATHENFRRRGIASQLIESSEAEAKAHDVFKTSLIFATGNKRLQAFYEKRGYKVVESRKVMKFPGCRHGGDWVLMVKDLI